MPNVTRKKRTNSRTLSGTHDTCPICHEEITAYAVSRCNHPTCFVCAIRMRVLMEQTYCSICRDSTPKILCTKKLCRFEEVDTTNFLRNKEYDGILFEETDIQKDVERLLLNSCQVCKKLFETFSSLNNHVKREHEVFFCELCLQNLKIFTCERKLYKRPELATHRRKGDPDDKSYRGHPLCEFCDDRFFDNDALIRHLRTEHYFCHFCEADQISNEFFSTYPDLKKHFRVKHFLCEEGECQKSQFTNAFRTEMDYRAHVARAHANKLSKQEAKQIRTFGIDFSYRGGRGRRYGGRGTSQPEPVNDNLNGSFEEPKEPEKFSENPEDFPTLDGRVLGGSNADKDKGSESRDTMARRLAFNTGQSVQDGEMGDFPALNKETRVSNNSGKWVRGGGQMPTSRASDDFPQLPKSQKPISFPSRPIHKPAPAQPRPVKEKPRTPAYSLKDDDFPDIPQSKYVPVGNTLSHAPESKISIVNPPETSNTVGSYHVMPNKRPDVSNTDDFPALGNPKANMKAPQPAVWKTPSKKEKKKKVELEPEEDLVPGLSLGEIAGLIPSNKQKGNTNRKEKEESPTTKTLENFENKTSPKPKSTKETKEVKNSKKPPPGFETAPRRLNIEQPSLTPYIPVEDFCLRNEKLQKKITTYLHDFSESLEKFKELAKKFRQNILTGQEYFIECQKLVGIEEFMGIVEELIALLPDICKQNELLDVFNSIQAAKDNKRKSWKKNEHSLVVCSNCRQVLRTGDKSNHDLSHSSDQLDFPELSSAPSNRFGMNSWSGKHT